MGYFAPTGTRRALIDKLAAALGKAVNGPDYIEKAKARGIEPIFKGSDEFGELVKSDVARYMRAVSAAGVRMQ